jgi:hypothetical protein
VNGSLALAGLLCLLAQAPDREMNRLARWLPGSYDTFAQATADSARGAAYRHVRAVLRIIPIAIQGMSGETRAYYLEQALDGQENAPYRQRVIVLRRIDGDIVSELYRVRDPAAFLAFDGRRVIEPTTLNREFGCDAKWMRVSDETYRGFVGREGRCPSTLRGATHTVSSFELTSQRFTTLDQGLDDAGVVRWGPPTGELGHIFVKRP